MNTFESLVEAAVAKTLDDAKNLQIRKDFTGSEISSRMVSAGRVFPVPNRGESESFRNRWLLSATRGELNFLKWSLVDTQKQLDKELEKAPVKKNSLGFVVNKDTEQTMRFDAYNTRRRERRVVYFKQEIQRIKAQIPKTESDIRHYEAVADDFKTRERKSQGKPDELTPAELAALVAEVDAMMTPEEKQAELDFLLGN